MKIMGWSIDTGTFDPVWHLRNLGKRKPKTVRKPSFGFGEALVPRDGRGKFMGPIEMVRRMYAKGEYLASRISFGLRTRAWAYSPMARDKDRPIDPLLAGVWAPDSRGHPLGDAQAQTEPPSNESSRSWAGSSWRSAQSAQGARGRAAGAYSDSRSRDLFLRGRAGARRLGAANASRVLPAPVRRALPAPPKALPAPPRRTDHDRDDR